MLVLPIKRLNRNGDKNNRRQRQQSRREMITVGNRLYIDHKFSVAERQVFCQLPNSMFHPFTLLNFSGFACWHIAVLPFQLVKELKMSARLRQPDFCLADYIQQRQTKQAHSRKVSDLKHRCKR